MLRRFWPLELTCFTYIEIGVGAGHIPATVPAESVVGGMEITPGQITQSTVSLGLSVSSLGVMNSVVNITNTAVQSCFFPLHPNTCDIRCTLHTERILNDLLSKFTLLKSTFIIKCLRVLSSKYNYLVSFTVSIAKRNSEQKEVGLVLHTKGLN